jgi:hypothetical protein
VLELKISVSQFLAAGVCLRILVSSCLLQSVQRMVHGVMI